MSIVAKLRVKQDVPLWLINAPAQVLPLLPGVELKTTLAGKDALQLLLFVKDKAELEKQYPKVLDKLAPDAVFWVAHPKKSGSIQSDLSRDEGWQIVYDSAYDPVSSISINEDWSALRLKKADTIKKRLRDTPQAERVVEGIDFVKRTVQLPADAVAAMKEFKGLEAFFNAMSFSHKKEYVEAIVEAKKPETRQRRIDKMIEMVLQLQEKKKIK